MAKKKKIELDRATMQCKEHIMSFDFEEIMDSMFEITAAFDSLPDDAKITAEQLEAVSLLHDSARGLMISAKQMIEDFKDWPRYT